MAAQPEVVRRQAEWERQIENLDQKEMELHQTQLRLIREQTASFIKDLDKLRLEVSALRAQHEGDHGCLESKLASLEREFPRHKDELGSLRTQLERHRSELGESLDRHGQLHQQAEIRMGSIPEFLQQHSDNLSRLQSSFQEEVTARNYHHSSHAERLDKLERNLQSQVATSRQSWDAELQELRMNVGTNTERMEYLERSIGDSAEKHYKELQSAHAKIDRLSHESLEERVEYVEKFLGDSADKHAEELAAAYAKLEHMHGRLATVERHGGTIQELQRAYAKHATVEERLEFLERSMGDSADAHLKELEALKVAHTKHQGKYAKELQDVKAFHEQHASMAERLNYVEKLLGDSADHHGEALQAAHSRLEQLHGRLQACESSQLFNDLKKAQASLAKEKEILDMHHASLKERVAYLEGQFGDSADQHAKELEALKTAHAKHEAVFTKHAKDLEATKGAHEKAKSATLERLGSIERALGEAGSRHSEDLSNAFSRLDQLHGRISSCEAHGGQLADLRKSHSNLASERAEMAQHHASMAERVEYLESTIGDSADKHAKAIEAAHTRLEQLHGRLAACEKHGGLIGDLKKAHDGLLDERATINEHQASLKERVDYLENMLGASADRHSKEVEILKANHARQVKDLQDVKAAHSQHASMPERLNYLEKVLGDSADRHAAELAEAHVKLDKVHGKVSAVEGLAASVSDLKKSHGIILNERENLEQHHASLKERMDNLEGFLGSSAGRDGESREGLASAHAKMDQMYRRLSELQKSCACLTTRADDHQATVEERLIFLERTLGDSADKHLAQAQEVEALRGAHTRYEGERSKHAKDIDALKAAHVQHASMEERLNYVEKVLGDSAEKHAAELAAAHARLDKVHSRVTACEQHGTSVSDLRKAHANLAKEKSELDEHHASLRERISFLESSLGDSADKHAKALEALKAAHTKLAQETKLGHGKLSDIVAQEKEARDEHHASVQERLKYVEGLIGDNADKHARELQAHKQAHGKLASDVKAGEAHHTTLEERLSFLEVTLGDSASKHAAELAGAQKKLEQLHGRLSDERAAREKHHTSVMDLLSKEKDARSSHHASIQERVDYLESVIGDNADKHTKELDAHKACHTRFVNEMNAKDCFHASLAERVDYLDKVFGDSAGKHATDLRMAHSKIEQMNSRIAAVQNAWRVGDW